MKRNYIVAILVVFVFAMVAPQNVVAKEKKIKYLGHTYKGSVDSKKAPYGNGVMNVEGLLIEGIFDSNSATDAEVCKVKFQEGTQLATFYGTITFDESENITLKAGGKMVTYYYPRDWGKISERKEMAEILSEDRIVNSDNFEPSEMKIKYSIKPIDISSVLNPPTEATGYYTLKLQEFGLEEKYNEYSPSGRTEEKYRTVKVMAFVDLPNKDKEAEMKIVNYKDGEGRIWNWERNPRIKWSVVYPDGSYYKYRGDKDIKNNWKIFFPDGKTVEFNPTYQDQFGCLSLDNSFYLINHDLNDPKGFAKLKSLGSPCYSKSNPEFYVYSNYYDFETLSSQEGEKLIKEHVLPYLKSESPDKEICVKVVAGNNPTDTRLGKYENGKYLSEAERKAKEQEEAEKEFKKNYAQACKKYGKPYVDAAINGKVIVGMPEELFLRIYTNCKLHAQTAQGKLYYVYSLQQKSNSRKIWYAEVVSKKVLVYNGKVTKILNR